MAPKKDDLEFIKVCLEEKGWCGTRLCREFPGRNWKVRAVNNAIKRLETTSSIARIQEVAALVQQELLKIKIMQWKTSCPKKNLEPVIGRYLGISHTSVKRMSLSTKNSEYLFLWHFFGVSIKTLHLLGI